MPYTIELDCPPGGIRPGDLLPGVLADTGIELDPAKPDTMFFGEWTWAIPEQQAEAYERVRDTVKERITALYHAGYIRWGSW